MAARRSVEWARCPIWSNVALVIEARDTATVAGLGGSAAVEELGISEGTEQEVPKGLGVGVGKDDYAGTEPMSTTGEESTGAAFFFFFTT